MDHTGTDPNMTGAAPQPPEAYTVEDWQRIAAGKITNEERAFFTVTDDSGAATLDLPKVDPALFAAARAFHRWPVGTLLTRDEFENAIREVGGLRFGGAIRETIVQGETRRVLEAKADEEAAKKQVDENAESDSSARPKGR